VHVDKVTPSAVTEGWDCTVPGPYTFSLHDGTIVQDTVNIHAPVSDRARQQAYDRMLPERNLIGMRNRSILYKPEKEYQQGLYIGTRMKKGDDVRVHYFNTLEEAKQAYRQGLIDVDDPIEIKHK
jgi:DNA-directed RNA polymerase subunit beta'